MANKQPKIELTYIGDELPEYGERVIGVTLGELPWEYSNLGEYEFVDIDHWIGNNGCTDKITHWFPISYIGIGQQSTCSCGTGSESEKNESWDVYDIRRIENIALRKSHDIIEIVKYYPNTLYGKKDQFEGPTNGGFYTSRVQSGYHVHESCFKYKESCYTLASWHSDELVYCGSRPSELSQHELKIFNDIVKLGYEWLSKNNEPYEY